MKANACFFHTNNRIISLFVALVKNLPKKIDKNPQKITLRSFSLLTEKDSSLFGIHRIDDGKGLKRIAEVSDASSAKLEALLDGNSEAFNCCACGFCYGDKSLESASVCKEIVNDEHVIVGVEESL